MKGLYRLNELQIGNRATVWELQGKSPLYRRLRDMGLVEGTLVECIGKSPFGDPAAYLIRGTVIAIRADDAKNILIRERRR